MSPAGRGREACSSPGRDRLCLIQSGWLIRVSERLMLNRITIKRSSCFFQGKDVEPQYVILSGLLTMGGELFHWVPACFRGSCFMPGRTGIKPPLDSGP